jgi:antirestriction protein ArdC
MPRERQPSESDPVAASLLQLERSVAAIQDSDTFRAYLTAQAKFHTYSFGNVLLILSQKPDATRVAGYRTWQSLDRQVKKGEKAIRIIAPASYKKTDRDEQTGDEMERQVRFFRSASVFDASQTEGEPLPEVPVPVLDSQAGAELYARLEGVALTEGLRVTIGHESFLKRPQLMGFYEPDNRAIYLKEAAQLQQTKTLAHELAHHFAEHQAAGPASETEAEAVSYVVLAHHGLDSGERSFPYIATWAKDKAVLKTALATIQTVSTTIIDKLDPDSPASQQEKAGRR